MILKVGCSIDLVRTNYFFLVASIFIQGSVALLLIASMNPWSYQHIE